jgi:hypothetical protein
MPTRGRREVTSRGWSLGYDGESVSSGQASTITAVHRGPGRGRLPACLPACLPHLCDVMTRHRCCLLVQLQAHRGGAATCGRVGTNSHASVDRSSYSMVKGDGASSVSVSTHVSDDGHGRSLVIPWPPRALIQVPCVDLKGLAEVEAPTPLIRGTRAHAA